jgi:hypothetical protein
MIHSIRSKGALWAVVSKASRHLPGFFVPKGMGIQPFDALTLAQAGGVETRKRYLNARPSGTGNKATFWGKIHAQHNLSLGQQLTEADVKMPFVNGATVPKRP